LIQDTKPVIFRDLYASLAARGSPNQVCEELESERIFLCADFQRQVEKTTQQNDGETTKKTAIPFFTRNFDIFGVMWYKCKINSAVLI
jgi:hypothetical protein